MKRLILLAAAAVCLWGFGPVQAAQTLKQSTSVVIMLGPFVDATDGVTPLTSLSITSSDIKIRKHGSTTISAKNDASGATHRADGYYTTTLNATDTNTTGMFEVECTKSGAAPVWCRFMVKAANPYDSDVSGTDKREIDVAQWKGTDVATPDTAGYPKVTLKTGTGAGELNITSGVAQANMLQVSDDATAASNFETMLDGTGGQTFTLGQLRINSTSADGAIDIDNTGGPGINVDSSGGDGVYINSSSSQGMEIRSTVDDALKIQTTGTNQDAVYLLGSGNAHGFHTSGGPNGGSGIWSAGSSGGHGIYASGAGAGYDIYADIQGSLSGSVGSVTSGVTVSTNNDKTGYSISGTKTTLDALNDITANSVWAVGDRQLTAFSFVVDADLQKILSHQLTQTGTQLADAFQAYFDVASQTFTSATPASWFKADVSNLDVAVSTRLAASAAPPNWSDFQITATTGRVSVGTNYDKQMYQISGTKTTLDDLNDVSAGDVWSYTVGDGRTVSSPKNITTTDGEIVVNGSGYVGANLILISDDNAAADALETMLDGTGGNALTLGQLRINSSAAGGAIDIDNSVGPGVSIASSADEGLYITTTGASQHAVYFQAGTSTGGDAFRLAGDGNGVALHAMGGAAAGDGIRAVGGSTGDDIQADIVGTLSGNVGGITGTKNTFDDLNDVSQSQITGGAYALDTDANGRIRIVSGTGAGELSISSGVVDSNIVQIKGSSSAANVMYAMYTGGCILGSVDDTSASSTSFITTLTSSVDGLYNDQYITFVEGALQGQSRKIHPTNGYNGTTKRITVANTFAQAPANDDDFVILGRSE